MSSSSAKKPSRAHAPGDGAGSALHDSRALLLAWIAVVCMIVGFGLVTLGLPVHGARLPLWISGGTIGLIGVMIAGFGRIMDNVE